MKLFEPFGSGFHRTRIGTSNIPKRIILIVACLCAITFIVTAVLSVSIRHIATSKIETAFERIGYQVEMKALELHPFRGEVRLEQFHVRRAGVELFNTGTIQMNFDFRALMSARRDGTLSKLLSRVAALQADNVLPELPRILSLAKSRGVLPNSLQFDFSALGIVQGVFSWKGASAETSLADASGETGNVVFNPNDVLSLTLRIDTPRWQERISSFELGALNGLLSDVEGANISLQLESHRPYSSIKVGGLIEMQGDGFGSLLQQPYDWSVAYQFDGKMQTMSRFPRGIPEIAAYPEPPKAFGSFTVDSGVLEFNSISLPVYAYVEGMVLPGDDALTGNLGNHGPFRIDLSFEPEGIPVQDIMRTIPEELLGMLKHVPAAGSVHGQAEASVLVAEPSRSNIDLNLSVEQLSVGALPASMNVFSLPGAFIHTIRDDDIGYERSILIPPYRRPSMDWMLANSEHSMSWVLRRWEEFDQFEPNGNDPVQDSELELDANYQYVYLEDMSEYIVSAILTGEDGDFFFHHGVDLNTLVDAVVRNSREGEIVFGASTISMQLIKNLFLNSQREYSRKLQESLLVFIMEQYIHLPKERILEIYLNIVEFGPGIYGIWDAAEYYFGVEPHDLSVSQSVWLASILPSPKRYHGYYVQGGISPGWFERMQWYFEVMLERGRITQQEFDARSIPEFWYGETSSSLK